MFGFIQRSSDPSQPGRALDKKNSKIPQFFVISLLSLYSPNLARTSFKMFFGEKWKSKSLTNSRDFYPDPPNN